MVLALLTIIRRVEISPLWSVQKAAADRIKAKKAARPKLKLVQQDKHRGLRAP